MKPDEWVRQGRVLRVAVGVLLGVCAVCLAAALRYGSGWEVVQFTGLTLVATALRRMTRDV